MKHCLEIALFLMGWCDGTRSALRGSQLSQPRDHVALRAGEKPTRDPNKPHDPIYYTTSYYSSESDSEPKEYNDPGTPGTTIDPRGPTTKPPQRTTPTGFEIKFEYDDLTDAAFAQIVDPKTFAADRDKAYKKTREVWAQLSYEANYVNQDFDLDKSFKMMCHQLGMTFFQAKLNLRDYYRIRYAYYNRKEFELGYVVQEIIHKYTVVLELFHTVQQRYYNVSKFIDAAPSAYMLYMYTVIVEQSQQIMHYCDVLSQIEKKYQGKGEPKNKKKGVAVSNMFEGIGDDGGDPGNEERQKELAAEAQKQLEFEARQKKRLQKEMQKRIRQQKKDMRQKTRYYSTRRTRIPRSFGRWPHHYGWSIETWYN